MIHLPSAEHPHRNNIFSIELPECINPKFRKEVDQQSGVILYYPSLWYDFDGVPHQHRCESYCCQRCRIIAAQNIAHAIKLAQPSYVFCFTLVPPDFKSISRRIHDFTFYGRQFDPAMEIAWTGERNPRGTGNHAHGLLHASKESERDIKKIFDYAPRRAGLRSRFWYEKIPDDPTDEYLGYLMDDLANEAEAEHFLELNSSLTLQYLIHSSEHFWRDGREGPFLNREQAEALARRRYRSKS